MSTIIQDLNDCEAHILTMPEAVLVAKQTHITRFVKSDLGWAEIKRDDLIKCLRYGELISVVVRKVPRFSTYHFSKP